MGSDYIFNNIPSFIVSNITVVERKLYIQKENIARNTAQNSVWIAKVVSLRMQSICPSICSFRIVREENGNS